MADALRQEIAPSGANKDEGGQATLGTSAIPWKDVQTIDQTVQRNLTIQGNLTVEGTTISLDSTTVKTEDPVLQLASVNTADVSDLGIIATTNTGATGQYTADTTEYHGLVRDASDSGQWKLFSAKHANLADQSGQSALTAFANADHYSISELQAKVNLPAAGDLKIATVPVTATAAQMNVLTDATVGTAVASKALVVDSDKDIDGLRNVAATQVTASFVGDVTGNADTATKLANSRTLSVTGDATGSAAFDGTANAAIALTIAETSVENSMLTGSIADTKLNTITTADKVSGSAIQLATTTALEDATGLKLKTTTAGDGLAIASQVLSVNVDDSSIETNSDTLRVKALGITNAMLTGSVENAKLSNSTVTITAGDGLSGGGSCALGATVSLAVGVDDSSIELNTDALRVKGSGITNAMLAGSIANDKLSNSAISIGGVSVSLGGSNAQPVLDLTSATNYPTSSLTGSITNAQLAGSIANDKLAGSITNNKLVNDSVSFGGVSLDLGGTNATPAFDLQSATGYPTGSLVGNITNAQLAGSIANDKLSNSSITIGDGSNSEVVALGGEFEIKGTTNEVEVVYNTTNNDFTIGLPSAITASLTGNSSTATALETSRTLSISGNGTGSAAFDGTGNADIALTLTQGAVDNAMLANDGISLKLGGVTQEDINLGDDLNFAGTSNEVDIAYASGSNTLTFGLPSTIAAELTGNSSTATALATPRAISVSGDASGTVDFDGSVDADIALIITQGAVDNAMLANDGISLQVDSVAQEDINLGDTLNFISGTDIDIAYNTTSNQLSIALESEIDSNTTGNAATATAWASARTITLGGDLGGSVNVDGSANAILTATIASTSVENAMLVNSTVTLSADAGSNDPVSLGETITFSGTTNEIETVVGSNQITIGLPNNVTVGNNLVATNDLTVTNGDLEITNGELNVTGGGASISGGVDINGTTTINGNLIANSATMKFQDTVIEVGYNNTAVVDHGWHSKHSDGEYVGQAYDQSASEFIAFKTDTKPTTTIDTSAGGYSLADQRVKDLHASTDVVAGSAFIGKGSNQVLQKLGYASVSGADTTLSGSQLVGGVILRDVGSTSHTDATATAANIVAALPADAKIADMSFEAKLILSNSSASYELTAGSGVTFVGTFASLSDGAVNVLVRITNATASSEAVTIYKL
jgi:hypothetical protein